jgi:cysteine sulfinate desulfinase/cysteine desulfurase-like protein
VLLAMGLSRAEASVTVRASLGRFTTAAQIAQAMPLIIAAART